MPVEEAIELLKQIDFKEINSLCSKNNINGRIDDFTKRKFDMALRTAYLLITQPIEIAISRQTKMDSINSLKDAKKVLDSLYLITKDQKYKNYIDGINEISSHSKLK
ncbi:hypothetical protein HYU23_00490 [Candidatus Woesearchaeota archaeon]|nr:hypothetical protein [Candidatus Woesearchaeota archaeon]